MQQIEIAAQNKKASKFESLLICYSKMVRHIDLSWNHIEPSLILMYQKLVDLGFVYYNGEIQIVEPETEESSYHAN